MKPGRGSRWLVEIWCGGGCHGSRPLTPSCSFAVRQGRRDGVDGRQAASTASMALSISFCNFVRAAAFAHKSERSGRVARQIEIGRASCRERGGGAGVSGAVRKESGE